MSYRVLIVDDEPSIRKVLRALLTNEGYDVELATNGREAVDLLQDQDFHAVITDQKMPEMDGLELLAWVRNNDPGLPVVLITAFGTVDAAKEAIKLGAHDYITKPFETEELKATLAKAVMSRVARSHTFHGERGRYDIIGRVPPMERIFELIAKVAATPSTVLISGESGTGKELVARALHDHSPRRDNNFVTVNCGAIPKDLFEAELFGHERGAFTGAHTSRPGRFEVSDGGTLFLDEVGELPLDLQVKLLRVIQERSFERVGGTRSLQVDVRLVAATNRDLEEATRQGRFRQDLFYRLNVVPIRLPPLRERRDDIPLLVEHFLDRFNRRLGRKIRGVSPEAMDRLKDWAWPGNIRELENVMERTVLLAESDDGIVPADLPELGTPTPEPPPIPPRAEGGETLNLKDYMKVHTTRLERDRIRQALERERWNVTRAARRLGISRKSLQTKMKDYGLREDTPPSNNGNP